MSQSRITGAVLLCWEDCTSILSKHLTTLLQRPIQLCRMVEDYDYWCVASINGRFSIPELHSLLDALSATTADFPDLIPEESNQTRSFSMEFSRALLQHFLHASWRYEHLTEEYSAAVKLNNMVITSLTTLGNGISNYTAQNLGAAKFDRIKSGFRAGIKLVWALCVPLVALYVFAGQPLVHIFLDSPTGQAMDTGVAFLRIIAPFYFIVSAKLVSDGVLRGAGLMKKFMIATFTDLVLRVALAEVLSRTALGTTGIWISWPIGWTVAAVCSIAFYATVRWEKVYTAA